MSKAALELHPVPVVSPWYHIGIDFIGPFTPASQGCSYILTISDTSASLCKLMQSMPQVCSQYIFYKMYILLILKANGLQTLQNILVKFVTNKKESWGQT